MNSIDWELVFYSVFLCSGIIGMLCQVALRLTLEPRVRNELPADKVYDGFYDGFFGFWRALTFANASILKGTRFKKTMAIFYEGFDVASFANRFEKTVAWIHLIAFAFLFSCMIFYFATMWLGIIEWSDT